MNPETRKQILGLAMLIVICLTVVAVTWILS